MIFCKTKFKDLLKYLKTFTEVICSGFKINKEAWIDRVNKTEASVGLNDTAAKPNGP